MQRRSPAGPVRIGLAGYGFGGRYFHAPLLGSAAEVELVGVVTTSPERAEQVRQETGRPVFDSLESLAAAGAEAVAISTPADTHMPLAQRALHAGLAVVCDKPFALDAASARATVELAASLGLPLSAYQNRRWDSDFLTVRHLVEDGRLGRVAVLESRFERYDPDPGPPAAGGGSLLDFGSHLVDQALVLLGPVRSVYAERHLNDAGLDDDVFVALTHRDGARSHLWGSWRQGAPGPRYRVTGTAATYVVPTLMDVQEELLLAGESPATLGERWGVEPEDRWGYVDGAEGRQTVPTLRGRWDTYYPAFAAAVRGDGPVPVDPWDAVATADVLDAARASAVSGETVTLPSAG
jgi:predicted dehydrogenase